jgi:isoamylase
MVGMDQEQLMDIATPTGPGRGPTARRLMNDNPHDTIREGEPYPLGVRWDAETGTHNFALFSRHATAVTLLLYTDEDVERAILEVTLHHPSNKSGRVWHCRIPASELRGARYYGYRVDGPEDGPRHHFDREKVLLDPYTRGIHYPPAFSRQAAIGRGSNAGQAPLGILPWEQDRHGLPGFDWGSERRPRHGAGAVIYELHVRCFTRHPSSGVAPERRGTFSGVIEKIPYLRELGVTTVELLPVFQFDPQEGNYWGYMPLGFFSVHAQYSRGGSAAEAFDEFRAMVRALHEAGIEVILDAVYNHTVEADLGGPTYSFRGIDNSSYYLLTPDLGAYRDDAGCGNVLRCAYPAVRRLILDSLYFWVSEMHIDGFRFDLASIFTRNADGTLNLEDPPIISVITEDRDLAGTRLIAEAWDARTYQLGRNFPGTTWQQWNGLFRDDVRGFLRGDLGMVPLVMHRLYGSDDLFPDTLAEAYRPHQSINYVTCHDGFTLYDLVSYTHKRNEANGHGNSDGTDDNWSWNCGWEGDEEVPAEVLELRIRQAKNFAALLFLANGTPMLRAGDEFLQTQGGNNNPYNQDNETSWLDWSRRERFAEVHRFFREMIAFRRRHPSLSRTRFWREDVRWHGAAPEAASRPDTSPASRTLAYSLRGRSAGDDDLYVMLNASPDPVLFTIHEADPGEWRRAIDTSLADATAVAEPGSEPPVTAPDYRVNPHSVVVLLRPRDLPV